jgi:hypothetical protein
VTPIDEAAVSAQARTDQAVAALAHDRLDTEDLAIAGQLAIAGRVAAGLAAEFGDQAPLAGRALVSAGFAAAGAYLGGLPPGVQPCAVSLALLQVVGRAGELLIHPPEGDDACGT